MAGVSSKRKLNKIIVSRMWVLDDASVTKPKIDQSTEYGEKTVGQNTSSPTIDTTFPPSSCEHAHGIRQYKDEDV